jgi:zinc transport system substrate-binding protein
MKHALIALSIFLAAAAFARCSADTPADRETPVIVTSIFPIYDITRSITGNRGEVFFVVDIGANPHTYEPTPATAKKIFQADIFIGVRKEFDGWIEKFLNPKARRLYLQEERDGGNPHIWLSIRKGKDIARRITRFMGAQYPAMKASCDSNLTAYLAQLDKTDAEISNILKPVKAKKMIQWHPAWDYFADDYGIIISGTVESGHGDQPSVKRFKLLIDRAKREGIRAVAISLNSEDRTAASLIREINGFPMRLDSIGSPGDRGKSSYVLLMKHNAETLARGLGKER